MLAPAIQFRACRGSGDELVDETVGVALTRLGRHPICLVLNHERIVLGLVAAEAMRNDDDQLVGPT